LPYERDGDALSMVRRHVYEEPRPIGDRVPARLGAVIMRSLSRDPRQRFADAEAFAVALAHAAGDVFGPGWLERSGVPVQLAPKVATAAAAVRRPDAETRTVRLPLVRPHEFDATRTIGLDDLAGAPLVPAREVLRRPGRSPLVPALVAAAAVTVLVFLAVAWPSEPERAAPLGLTVGTASAAAPVAVDLTRPVELGGGPVPAGAGPLTARLTLTAAGASLGAATAPVTVANGGWRATVEPPPYARWVAGGAVTGEVTLLRGGAAVGAQEFTVEPDGGPLLSVMGAGSVLLLLFALAYLESVVRSLRRGRRQHTGPVLAAAVGLLFGAAVWLLVSVLLRQEPAAGVGAACAGLGAVAAAAVAWAFRRPHRS
jgi:serine/threonine-protein kinase